MTTVTAKQLRENLSAYLDRVEAGEEIAIIRHSAIIGKLRPTQKERSNSMRVAESIRKYQRYLAENDIVFHTDPDKSIKQLYHGAMDNDPKYARYVKK